MKPCVASRTINNQRRRTMEKLFDFSMLLAECIVFLEVVFLVFCYSSAYEPSKFPGTLRRTRIVQSVGKYLYNRFLGDFELLAFILLVFAWPLACGAFPCVSWLLGIADCYNLRVDTSSGMDWVLVLVETAIWVGMYNTMLFGSAD